MKKTSAISGISLIMNLLIILISIQGASIVFEKSYLLFFKPDKIKLVRLEMPWTHPVSNVTIMLHKDILENNPNIHREVSKNIFIHDFIKRVSLVTLLILILIQLKRLLIAINMKTFFELKNLHIIRNLSILVGLWVVCKFIMYQLIPVFIPLELMYERINFTALNESLLLSLLAAIDFKMLFVAIILYIISISFQEGYKLKEQTDLTI